MAFKFLSRFTSKLGVTELPALAITLAAARVFEPVLTPAVQDMEGRFGNTPMTPDQLVTAVFRGLHSAAGAANDAGRMGMQAETFRRLVESSRPVLEPGIILAGLRKSLISEGQAGQSLARLGYGATDIRALLAARFEPAPAGTVLEMLNRGGISEGEAKTQLAATGLEPKIAGAVLELRKVIPPITDLIRFTVREAFNDAFAGQFGLDEEFPAQVVPFAGKQGLSEEWVKRYWRAHWDLPSPTQGFEMFHRSIISEEQLKLLLKALDITPFWRERLLGISYNPLTRVDIRRMYRDGTIDREQVMRAHLDIGYSPENATLLTEWVTAERMRSERDLTKAEVVKAYRERAITADAAKGLLQDMGYDGAESDLILQLADVAQERSVRDKKVARIRSRFVGRRLPREDASAALDTFGVPAGEREALLEEWEAEQDAVQKDLTVAQWQKALRLGIVDGEIFLAEMVRQGYDGQEAEILARLATTTAAGAGAEG